MTNQHWIHEIEESFTLRSLELQSAQSRPIVGIASRRIAGGDCDGVEMDREIERPIRLDGILYVFTQGAVGHHPLIIAPWVKAVSVPEASVYIRTWDALYRVHYSSLKALKEILPDSFQQVSRSVVANLALVEELQLQGGATRGHRLTYVVADNALTSRGFELLKIGREFIAAVRTRFGYPRVVSERTTLDGDSPSPSTVHPVGTGPLSDLLFIKGIEESEE